MKRATTPGYMLARHIKPKKIFFHSRLLPHETCGMKRMQQSREDSQMSPGNPSTLRVRAQQRLIRSILVPVDFSDCSLAGLKYAVRFAKELGARIVVLHVADLGPVMMTTGRGDYDSPTYIEAARRRCGDQMKGFLKRVSFDGVPVDASAVAGYCPGAIYEAAAKEGADLIIISTHGRTGLRRAFIGSVAEGTVRHAACPVLVVPSFSLGGKRGSSETARQPAQRTSAKQPSARSRLSKS
jgi:nucleotide-binding universal stress UspA family protein